MGVSPVTAKGSELPDWGFDLAAQCLRSLATRDTGGRLIGLIAVLRRSICTSLNGSAVCSYLQSFSGQRPIHSIRPSHLAQTKSRRVTLPRSRFTTSSLPSYGRSCPSTCAQVLTTFRSPTSPLTSNLLPSSCAP